MRVALLCLHIWAAMLSCRESSTRAAMRRSRNVHPIQRARGKIFTVDSWRAVGQTARSDPKDIRRRSKVGALRPTPLLSDSIIVPITILYCCLTCIAGSSTRHGRPRLPWWKPTAAATETRRGVLQWWSNCRRLRLNLEQSESLARSLQSTCTVSSWGTARHTHVVLFNAEAVTLGSARRRDDVSQ